MLALHCESASTDEDFINQCALMDFGESQHMLRFTLDSVDKVFTMHTQRNLESFSCAVYYLYILSSHSHIFFPHQFLLLFLHHSSTQVRRHHTPPSARLSYLASLSGVVSNVPILASRDLLRVSFNVWDRCAHPCARGCISRDCTSLGNWFY